MAASNSVSSVVEEKSCDMSSTDGTIISDPMNTLIGNGQELIDKICKLFDDYRCIKELEFNTSIEEKNKKLYNIEQEIRFVLEMIETHYPHVAKCNSFSLHSASATPSRQQSASNSCSNILLQHSRSRSATVDATEHKSADLSDPTSANTTNTSNNANNSSTSNSSNESVEPPLPQQELISRALYLFWKGSYFKLLGEFEIAKPLLVESIKLEPRILGNWNALSDVYCELNETLAGKYCLESSLDFDMFNKVSYVQLSAILRKHSIATNDMQIRDNSIQSLVLAKFVFKLSKLMKQYSNLCNDICGLATSQRDMRARHDINAIQDGELWFSLGNAYLTAFLRCVDASIIMTQNGGDTVTKSKLLAKIANSAKNNETNNKNNKETKNGETSEKNECSPAPASTSAASAVEAGTGEEEGVAKDGKKSEYSDLDVFDLEFVGFEENREKIFKEIRTEIMSEMMDEKNTLINHKFLQKCFASYKHAISVCSVNSHACHPDLYHNRALVHLHLENYQNAINDLVQSIKFVSNGDTTGIAPCASVASATYGSDSDASKSNKNSNNNNNKNKNKSGGNDGKGGKGGKKGKKGKNKNNKKNGKNGKKGGKESGKNENDDTSNSETSFRKSEKGGNDGLSDCKAKLNGLIAKLVKMTNMCQRRGGSGNDNELENKISKRVHSWHEGIVQFSPVAAYYFAKNCKSNLIKEGIGELTEYDTNNGLNANINKCIVVKLISWIQSTDMTLPYHFLCVDTNDNVFILSYYCKIKEALLKSINQSKITPHCLVAINNPVLKKYKFEHGNKKFDFSVVTFERPSDICIGGKLLSQLP